MGCKKLNIRNFFTFNGRGNTAFHYDSKGNWNSIIANGPLESRAHNEVNQLTVREASPLTYDEIAQRCLMFIVNKSPFVALISL